MVKTINWNYSYFCMITFALPSHYPLTTPFMYPVTHSLTYSDIFTRPLPLSVYSVAGLNTFILSHLLIYSLTIPRTPSHHLSHPHFPSLFFYQVCGSRTGCFRSTPLSTLGTSPPYPRQHYERQVRLGQSNDFCAFHYHFIFDATLWNNRR